MSSLNKSRNGILELKHSSRDLTSLRGEVSFILPAFEGTVSLWYYWRSWQGMSPAWLNMWGPNI